jgi:hypothetical protein
LWKNALGKKRKKTKGILYREGNKDVVCCVAANLRLLKTVAWFRLKPSFLVAWRQSPGKGILNNGGTRALNFVQRI